MKWKPIFSAPSTDAVERGLRRIYGTQDIFISAGRIVCRNSPMMGVRVRKCQNRFRVEAAA